MKNLREKVLGTNVKRDSVFTTSWRPSVFCLLKKVSQTKDERFCVQCFILRFHDLAFLHFRRFGQVGYLVTVQTWQRTKSWRASCHFAIFPSLVNFDFHFILSLTSNLGFAFAFILSLTLNLGFDFEPWLCFTPVFALDFILSLTLGRRSL